MNSKFRRFVIATAKNATRIAAAALLICLLAGVTLLFVPFSFDFIDRRARDAFKSDTGLDLQFDALLFYLAQGKAVLRDCTVSDPATGEALAGARRIEVGFRPRLSRSQDLRHISSLHIEDPLMLQFRLSPNGITAGPRLAKLLAAEKSTATYLKSPRAENWRVDSLVLKGGVFEVRNRDGQEFLQIGKGDLIGQWGGPGDFEFLANGAIAAGRDNGAIHWLGRFSSLPGEAGLSFFTQFEGLPAGGRIIAELPISASGRNIRLAGEIRPSPAGPQGVNAKLRIQADDFLVVNEAANSSLDAPDLSLDIEGDYLPESSLLSLRSFDAAFAGLSLAGAANVGLAAPFAYDLNLHQMEISEAAMLRFQEFSPNIAQAVRFRGGRLSGAALARGALAEGRPKDVTAQMALHGASFAIPATRIPLEDLTGTLNYDGQTLNAEGLKGRFSGAAVELNGALSSDNPGGLREGSPCELALRWRLQGAGGDLTAFLASLDSPALRGLTCRGEIESTGSLTAAFGDPPSLESAAESLDAVGAIGLKDFQIDHPSLPAPFTAINGAIGVKNSELTFNNMRGVSMDSSVDILGAIQGARYFWTRPRIRIRLVSEMQLKSLNPALSKALGPDYVFAPQGGRADLDLRLSGALDQLDSLLLSGHLSFKGLSADAEIPMFRGRIREARGRISYDANHLTFENLEFYLNEPRYRLDGELSRGDLRGRVEFTGPCKSLQQNHPPFMKQARLDGTIDGAVDFHFSLPEPERSRSLADKRFPLFLSFADGIQSVCVRQTDPLQAFPEICPDLDGSFQLQNAEISFAMLPVRLTEANGALHLTNNGVHYQGAKLKAGGYPAVASGEYLFSHEGHREFRFDMKADDADLTPWYGPWPKRPKPGAPRSSSSARQPYLRAVIKGDVHAGQSKLRQFNFRSHSGSVFFEQWDNADNHLRLENIAIEAYQGTAKAHGRFRFAQGRKPSWDFDIEAAGMEIQELLSDLNRRPIDSSGRLSGKVKLAGVGGDPKSVTGEGKLMVRDARLSGPGLFAEIRKMLGIESWTRAAAPEIEGDFIVKDGYVQSDNVEMGSELAKLSATGKVWFNSHIDLVIAIRPLSILGDIPLVEYLSKFTDAVARSLLKFHASGPAGNPEVKPIPFSADIIFPRALEGKSAASSSTAAQEAPQPQ